jgi:S-(hydroxymethyl)glutathione dehydrogenase/alcohol dehydrogenase
MRTKAAVTYGPHQPFVVKEVELDEPKDDEVLVHLAASGICHSDWHFVAGEQEVKHWPMVLGHEGAGIVAKVGASVRHVKPGDHVVMSYLPSCGKCYWCIAGHSNLCDEGAETLSGPQLEGTFRMHDDDGTDIGQALFVSTFSEWTVVPMHSVVKVFDHYPLHRACLTACGVVAGIGTAIYLGDIRPGAVCAVWGVGGIGMNIVQGCRLKGARAIVAVDLVDWKLEKAREFGATHTVNPSKQDAVAFINDLSWGRGADNTFEAIATPATIADALRATGKTGTCVVIGLSHFTDPAIPFPPTDLVLYQRTLRGSLYGGANPHNDIPKMLRMWEDGKIDIDGLVTKEYRIEEINEAYADLLAGKLLRGVIRYDWAR